MESSDSLTTERGRGSIEASAPGRRAADFAHSSAHKHIIDPHQPLEWLIDGGNTPRHSRNSRGTSCNTSSGTSRTRHSSGDRISIQHYTNGIDDGLIGTRKSLLDADGLMKSDVLCNHFGVKEHLEGNDEVAPVPLRSASLILRFCAFFGWYIRDLISARYPSSGSICSAATLFKERFIETLDATDCNRIHTHSLAMEFRNSREVGSLSNEAFYSLFDGFQNYVSILKDSREFGRILNHPVYGLGNTYNGSEYSSSQDMDLRRQRLCNSFDNYSMHKSIASYEIHVIQHKMAALEAARNRLTDTIASAEIREKILSNELKELGIPLESTRFSNNKQRINKTQQHPSSMKCHSTSFERNTTAILHQQYEFGSIIQSFKTGEKLVQCLDFDKPFGVLACCSESSCNINVYDMSTNHLISSYLGHNDTIQCIKIHRNRVISGSKDTKIKVWDLQRTEDLFQRCGIADNLPEKTSEDSTFDELSDFWIRSPSRSTDTLLSNDLCLHTYEQNMGEITALDAFRTTLISGSEDRTIRQFDLAAGKLVQTLDLSLDVIQSLSRSNILQGRASFVGDLQCYETAVASGTIDGVIRLWDLRIGRAVRTFTGSSSPVTGLRFDNNHIVAGFADGTLKIWEIRTGKIENSLEISKTIKSLQMDTKTILSVTGDPAVFAYDRKAANVNQIGEDFLAPKDSMGRVGYNCLQLKEGMLAIGQIDGSISYFSC